MKRMPNMLMAGAAGRNRGKTEFLCLAIREQAATVPVIGIKVTTIDDTQADYRNIAGDFIISVEQPGDDNKDTHRMYRAGATKVFWLRVKRPSLEAGLNHLFQSLETEGINPNIACLVMESGGARNFIEPGLFFIIQEHNDALKPAVAEVAHLADRLNNVSGNGWDVIPENLSFENDRWGLKENAAAIILSGGGSRRMGEDKAILTIHGQPLLSSVVEQLVPNFGTVLVSGSYEKYTFTGCRVVEDLEPDRGPLMGLLSTLKESSHALNFITTCDVPDIQLPFVRRMLREIDGHDAVVPIIGNDRKQPLFAVYKKSVSRTIEELMAEGKQAMFALLDRLDVKYLHMDGDWYHNLNTPDELEHYRKTCT
ncbi:molybdenum cofactor guanylyltransferase [Pontiellaceae bacterium B1224]|nr:molybdenum cofactor guanylyltransferase [Pontiellaceae bacterium B1224]